MVQHTAKRSEVEVVAGGITLAGTLILPRTCAGLVVFAHGSGSSRRSPRNQFVAEVLHGADLGTLLFDLLTVDEERVDLATGKLRFDIDLLSDRLTGTVDWVEEQDALQGLPVGLFGASTGAAAALETASRRPNTVRAVVSRGGRPDLAPRALPLVQAPTLLIVGGLDHAVIQMNRSAAKMLRVPHAIEIVPGATHLFEELGTLEEVARLAADWFARHLTSRAQRAAQTPPTSH